MSATIKYLFRFRDLVADTLKEHADVIASSVGKGCWWGWWKRPSEDARSDIWDELEAEVAKSGFVWIGLFHSGDKSGKPVSLAKVTQVVKPVDADASRPPKVPNGEEHLIPEYYRNSIFSRAWMRIAEIQANAVHPFFETYAYSQPPPLPKIPPHMLAKLKAKCIMDTDELRAMDTTIWRVELAATTANKSHFLVPSSRVVDAVSASPIPLKKTKILHLTDIHFELNAKGSRHVWHPDKKFHDMVSLALQQKPDIGILLITGDFTFRGTQQEFDEALASINALVGTLGLGPDEIVICPGNHDIRFVKDKTATYDAKTEGAPAVAPAEAQEQYRKFYGALLQHDANAQLSMARRFVLPHGRVVDFISLNTSNLATGEKYLAGMGRIDTTAFEAARIALGWEEYSSSPALRFLALHHHLVQTEDVERPAEYEKGFGLAIDAQKMLREAARFGTHVAFHGHRHRAFYWRAGVYALPEHTEKRWHCGDVSIIGGGSAGSTDVADDSNYFNIIDIRPDKIVSTMYRSQKRGPFRAIKSWVAEILPDKERGIVLSAWKIEE